MAVAQCPKNSHHQRFSTTAHVLEEWEVDANGTFVQVLTSLEIVHGPDKGNVWECLECGAHADIIS